MKPPACDLISRVSVSFVLKNGRISGIVVQAINFMPNTQLWVLLEILKLFPAMRR